MNSEEKQFLFRLLDTPSPTGFESEGQKVWMNYAGRFADSLDNDTYGNAWATLVSKESSARIMLEAHADEIGFMIQNITDDGFLYVTPIGGSDRAIARGKRVRILGEKGPVLGVIGNVAIHLAGKLDRQVAREKVQPSRVTIVDSKVTVAVACVISLLQAKRAQFGWIGGVKALVGTLDDPAEVGIRGNTQGS
jgi:putative aminopeptidase FrvX